ncbi:PREDICTED: LOW QUALITY PROTEIN: protein NRT1/ PTR FAMILY 5.13-like [Camelina sativa]|uniref:LOW QUALITY PROTEIN: protein NRT1/ PTR FAMILY 5.13-like n=1 Tax=Camelina sativa TaxID=90675 RepID=A0ABM0STL0_CAMSA|nr:PREDICTED: LOW QUALITY PROTEIN: protein NRT1/ PTR FAMILY 5.13-like [Camelina sativa]
MANSGEERVIDAVDHRGFDARRSNTGRWRAAWFIIGVEVAERFAHYGIGSNLISYLTGPLGQTQSTAVAAANVNAWSGISTILPVLGAFVADAFLGRYRTIIIASLIYVLGLAFLTSSAFMIPNTTEVTSSPSSFVNALFFFSLYLVAIGQSVHKPCVQAFGADQFDEKNPQEYRDRSSFFNWWYLSICAGISLAVLVVVYIQEYVSWALGFGIPCVFMVISLVLFVLGRRIYRYSKRRQVEETNPFTRIGRVFLLAFKNQRLSSSELCKAELEANPSQDSPEELSFLNKALLVPNDGEMSCKSRDVEDATALVKLIPVWLTTLSYAIPYAQYMTFFTKQGVTMERTIFPGVMIPPASLQALISLSIIVFVPIYDRVLVPMGKSITKDPCGITTLKRIGTGMVIATLTMVVAALVESKRLKTAKEHGLVDQPNTTGPMSIWWLFPQYILLGLADLHTLVGMQEFFYSQVPTELRSIGMALYLSALGVGSLLSSLLIYLIDLTTGGDAGDSWFNSNLNRAHLDYFYYLLAVVSAVGFFTFLFISRSYTYRRVDGV